MGVDFNTPILTRRGVLYHDQVTTDDETMARLPDASLVWTPITGISVAENQYFIDVYAPRASFRCAYDQRVWLARRSTAGIVTREVIDTLDNRREQDYVIFSGVYLGGLTGRRSHMSVPEARLLALLVAGHGEFYEQDGDTHLLFRPNSLTLPKWFLRFALDGIDFREYTHEWVVSPEKSRRMERLMRKPIVDVLFTMTLERREEFLSVFFGLPKSHDVPEVVSLACYMCYQIAGQAGTVPIADASFSTSMSTAWSVTTEAGGWTVKQGEHFMALSS